MNDTLPQRGSRAEWAHLAMVAALFAASGLVWPYSPERVPMHWNAAGEIDGWGNRLEGLFLLPALTLGIYLLLRFIPRLDPGRENYKHFERPYAIIRFATTGLMCAVHAMVLAWVLGFKADVGLVVGGGVGMLFIVIGNFLGKIRPNWFVGIRTPWTLSSKLAWTRTHRAGGRLFIVLGSAFLLTGFVKMEWMIPCVIAGSLGGSLSLVVYSYYIWRSDPDRVPPAGTAPAREDSHESN